MIQPSRAKSQARSGARHWTLESGRADGKPHHWWWHLRVTLDRRRNPRRSSPIAYLIAATGMGVIAACVAEVASRFQQAGGPYLYAKVAFGRFLGLQTGWLLWLTRVSAAAAVANVFIDYLLGFWPQAKGSATRLVILTIPIGGLAAKNIRGVKMGTRVSNFFTVAKGAAAGDSSGWRPCLYSRSWQSSSSSG